MTDRLEEIKKEVASGYFKNVPELIAEVERLREDKANRDFVDEMNELADIMEVVETGGKLVTEHSLRNWVARLSDDRDLWKRRAGNALKALHEYHTCTWKMEDFDDEPR